MKTIVNNYNYRGRNFTIVNDQGMYMAIEDKYLDENGCLTQQLRGRQLHPAYSVEACMASVNEHCDIDYHVANGMTEAEAVSVVLKIPYQLVAAVFDVEA